MTESAHATPLPTSTLPTRQTLAERVLQRAAARGMNNRELAAELGFAESVLSEWRRGKYEHKSKVDAAALAWLTRLAIAEPLNYVALSASSMAIEACESAIKHSALVLIVGEPGIGKTVGVNEFRRQMAHRNQEVIHYRCLSTIRQHSFLRSLCQRFELGASGPSDELLHRIIGYLTRKPSPIVLDEANHMKVPCLEIVRDIYDVVGTPIILCGSLTLLRTLTQASNSHTELDQLHGRIELRAYLQPMSAAETGRFVRSHIADASKDVCEEYYRHSRGIVRKVRIAIKNTEEILSLNPSETLTPKVVEAAFRRMVMGAN